MGVLNWFLKVQQVVEVLNRLLSLISIDQWDLIGRFHSGRQIPAQAVRGSERSPRSYYYHRSLRVQTAGWFDKKLLTLKSS